MAERLIHEGAGGARHERPFLDTVKMTPAGWLVPETGEVIAFIRAQVSPDGELQGDCVADMLARELQARGEPSAERDYVTLQDVYRNLSWLWRKKILIIGTTLAVTLLSVAYTHVRGESYKAVASILVGQSLSGGSDALISRMKELNARSARLTAELQGGELVFPPTLIADPTASQLLEGERVLFLARQRERDERLKGFRKLRELYLQRVSPLNSQIEFAIAQQEAIDKELTAVRSLVEKRLAVQPRLLDLEVSAATAASRKVELETALLRLNESIQQVDQRIVEAQNEHRAETAAELQATTSEVRQSELGLGGAPQALSASNVQVAVHDQIAVIKSDRVLMNVVEQLGLQIDEDFWVSEVKMDLEEVPQDETSQLALNALKRAVTVNQVGAGSRVDIEAHSSDPGRAALIANTVAAAYLEAVPVVQGSASTREPSGEIVSAAFPVPDGPSYNLIIAISVVPGLISGVTVACLLELAAGFKKFRDIDLRPGASLSSRGDLAYIIARKGNVWSVQLNGEEVARRDTLRMVIEEGIALGLLAQQRGDFAQVLIDDGRWFRTVWANGRYYLDRSGTMIQPPEIMPVLTRPTAVSA